MHVLVVDDEASILAMMQMWLEMEHWQVTTLPDGRGVVEAMAAGGIDVLLLDGMLPHKNGLEVLRELQAAGNLVPVILMSGRFGHDMTVLAQALGAITFLQKPVDMAALSALLDAVTGR